MRAEFGVSERRACAVLRRPRSTQRKPPKGRDDEAALTADIVELPKTYGRYGYGRITALLRHAGWAVNAKRAAGSLRRRGGQGDAGEPAARLHAGRGIAATGGGKTSRPPGLGLRKVFSVA